MPKGKRGRKLFLISLSRRSLPLFKLNHLLRLRHRHDKTTDRVLAGTPQTIDVTRQGRTKLLRHERRGTLSASGSPSAVGSQFFLTLSADLDSLDGKHAAFGVVAEGLEVLDAIGEAAVDAGGVPLQNIRIKHTLVLENPFLDDGGNEGGEERFICRDASPPSQGPFGDNGRLEDNWRPAAKEEDKKNKKKRKKKEDGDDESDGGGDDDDSGEENSGDDDEVASIAAAAARRREGAAARAVVLEMVGDLPAADVAPPETVLFVCKLNPVTREQDLEVVFGRFGRVVSCDVVRDGGASLGYAFVGFETRAAAESAYLKMNNVLLDDRRIKVDFSQSVGHLWKRFKSGGGGRGGGGRSAGGRGSGGGGRGQQQRQGGLLPPRLFPPSTHPPAQARQQQQQQQDHRQREQREEGEKEETATTRRRSRWSPERSGGRGEDGGGGGGGRREPSPGRRRSARSRSRSRSHSPRRRERSRSRERRRGSRSRSRSSSSSRSRSRSRSRGGDGKKKKKEKEKKKHHHHHHKHKKHRHHHHDGDDHKKKKK